MVKRPYILKASVNSRAARGRGVVRDLSAQAARSSASNGNVNGGPTANEGQGSSWFGPLEPMNPTAPAAVAGRAFDYPSGYNLSLQPRAYNEIGFPTLRAFADSYDLLRLIIETRKDQIENLRWEVVPRDPDKRLSDDPDLKARAKKITDFFRRPDRDHFWGQWLRSILEDLLVIDAPSIYIRKTFGGDLFALEQIDGATIKRVIDDYGRTPEEGPAYQQVLKGLPAVDYTKEELIYRPRNTRVQKVYGYSPVEQIIMTVNIALRRQVFQLNYFTEGNIPEALIGVPETWTPDQIRVFQDWFDNMLAGNLAERRKARFVPSAVGKTYIETKSTELFGAAEEWFSRVVCFAFSISPLPFIKMTKSSSDSADEAAKEEGLGPLKNWVNDLMDSIIIDLFKDDDLEFRWKEPEELDLQKKSEMLINEAGKGLRPLNEVRRKMGEQPYEGEHFDKPMVMTSMGYSPIDPAMTAQQMMTGNDSRLDQGKDTDHPSPKGKEPPSQVSGEKPKEKEGATTKTMDFFQQARKAAAIPYNRPKVNAATQVTTAVTYKYLQRWGNMLAGDVEEQLTARGVRKAEEEIDLDALLAQLDWEISQAFEHAMADNLYSVASDSGQMAASQFVNYGLTDKTFNQVNDRAVTWANARAAELVSVNGDRNLVEGTRNGIRQLITQGLADNLSAREIAQSIREGYSFSIERATNIAHYEIASANSHGALEGYREAMAQGLKLGKGWSTDLDPCPTCQSNADVGIIPLEEEFPSGDMAPAAHPHCECAIYAEEVA